MVVSVGRPELVGTGHFWPGSRFGSPAARFTGWMVAAAGSVRQVDIHLRGEERGEMERQRTEDKGEVLKGARQLPC